ncbi:hypothetical protein GCM10009775_29960 [Microbacterium aoyamense]|uniref:Uncharacterized protein n=1 Tax=Microbacterium aoyamense TaxID=344166 RepID=A0ABP5B846_9MICO
MPHLDPELSFPCPFRLCGTAPGFGGLTASDLVAIACQGSDKEDLQPARWEKTMGADG